MRISKLSGIFLAGLLGAACSSESGSTDDMAVPSLVPPGDGTGDPSVPGTGDPSVPGTAGPVTPGTAGPVTPGTAGPATPGTGPATPGTTDPAIPGTTDPAIPGTTDPVVPGDSKCVPGVPETSQVPRMKNRVYDAAVRDLLGVTTVSSRPPSAMLAEDLEGDLNSTAWSAYLDSASAIAAEVMAGPNKSKFIACDPAAAGCLAETVATFGRKALRHKLSDEEVASYMRFDSLEPKGEPAEVAEAILFGFLASPSFIMMPELTDVKDTVQTDAFKLSDVEIATRLSILIWGSIPDEELNAAADKGELNTPAQILAQAQRMAKVEEKSGPLLADLHKFYVDVRNGAHWDTMDHDAAKYPAFPGKALFNPAMMSELSMFFADVAFNGSFKDLLLSNVAYVNKDTAAAYGLNPADFTEEMKRTELKAEERPGFLTRVAFLSSYSHEDATSPILRGAYLNRNVIGVSPGMPSEEALGAKAPDADYQTEREYTDALTAPSDCAGCHHPMINPPGYVLEGFDSVGGIQTEDPRGGALNTTADVLLGSEVKTISTPLELMQAIAALDSAKRLYAEKWVTYTTGRPDNVNDACLVDSLVTKLGTEGYPILDLFTDISQADSVRLRSAAQ